jgi:3-hydroxyisobutyrate dehydrogenase-like beta-hydroxyacid dehydrogenase
MNQIGIIGVGYIGDHLLESLLENDYRVLVYDINDERIELAVDRGADIADSPASLTKQVDCVFLALPGTSEVEATMDAADGILTALEDTDGHLIIDVTTTHPTTSIKYERKCRERDACFIEAPITGGSPRKGMHMMIGSNKNDYQVSTKILDSVCADHVRVGEVGKGTILKLALQMRYAGHHAVDAEIVEFARDNGVDPNLLNNFFKFDVMERYFSDNYNQEISGLGGLAIWHKDIGYARQVARENDTALPLAGVVHEAYKATNRRVDESEGHAAALIEYWRMLNQD